MRLLLSAVLTALSLLGCAENLSVEQQVIATLEAMEEAAEEGQHFEFMGHVADSFRGQSGSMDRRAFQRFMIFQINQNRRLQAQFFPIYVRESGPDLATAHFRILVTGGSGLLPESGQLFEVETQWLRDGGDWMLDQADWQPVQLPDIQTGRK